MGDRCTVLFRVGGKISELRARKLIRLMDDYGLVSVEDGEHEPNFDNLGDWFEAEEINFGTMATLTDYCMTLGIPYILENGQGGSYGPGIDKFMDGEQRTAEHVDGEPLVPYSRILETESLVSALAPLIAEAKFWARELPDVEIIWREK